MIDYSYAYFFQDEGIGTYYDPDTAPNGNIFVRQVPDEGDVICLFLTTAPQGIEHLRYDLNNSGVKVMLRGSDSFCKDKMEDIEKVLGQMKGTYDGIYIKETLKQTEWAHIENDDKGRAVYTATYESEYSIGATSRTAT